MVQKLPFLMITGIFGMKVEFQRAACYIRIHMLGNGGQKRKEKDHDLVRVSMTFPPNEQKSPRLVYMTGRTISRGSLSSDDRETCCRFDELQEILARRKTPHSSSQLEYLVGLEWMKHVEKNERASLGMVRFDVDTVQPASVDVMHISGEFDTVSTNTSRKQSAYLP